VAKTENGQTVIEYTRAMAVRLNVGDLALAASGTLTPRFQPLKMAMRIRIAKPDGSVMETNTTAILGNGKAKLSKTENGVATDKEVALPDQGVVDGTEWIFQAANLRGVNSFAFRELDPAEFAVESKQYTVSREADGNVRVADKKGSFYVLGKDGSLVRDGSGELPIEEVVVPKARFDEVRTAMQKPGKPAAQPAAAPAVQLVPFDGGRFVEAAGGFSYVPPKDWKMVKGAGQKFAFPSGPATEGFAVTLLFAEEAFKGTVAEYWAAAEKNFTSAFKNFKKVSQADFKTEAGQPAIQMVIENEQAGRHVRQCVYILKGAPDKIIAAFGTVLSEQGNAYDAEMDACIKSFRAETGAANPAPEAAKPDAAQPAVPKGAKIYTLKDGTRIVAVQIIEAGDTVMLKDAQGKRYNLEKADIESVKEP
jgi:hypothetical protein